jgi:hypothetical protein
VIEWPNGIRHLPISSHSTPQQLPGRLHQVASVEGLEALPLDPFLGLAEQLLTPRPTILGEAEIIAIGS